jgi:hypothetical protein
MRLTLMRDELAGSSRAGSLVTSDAGGVLERLSRPDVFFDLDNEARMRSEMNFDMHTPMSGAHHILQRTPVSTGIV